MAFFGEDGLQRQLKQAQRDLMEKDREIGTMFLSSKGKDEALKKLRVEVERLQEERDELANNAGGSANHANEAAERSRLKTELKEAQDALNKACMENNKLRDEARQTSLNLNDARLRKVSGSSSSSSKLASPSTNRSSRRRSTSLSADTRVQDLEAELTMLRQSAGSPALEVDGLKTQLANVRRELNKTINEKIAIETRSRKEVESVKNQLDDANFELDNIRRDLEDGGSVSKKEVEKRQRSWEGEKAELVVRIRDLESVVADNKALISTMKASANDAVRLQAELDQTLLDRASSSTGPDNSLQVTRLTEEVSALQQELTRALAQTPTSVSSSSSGDLTIRRLERKLEKAQRDTEALEESLNQAEEENQALRSRVPLPGSPGRKSDDGRQMALEAENENLQGELAGLRAQLAGLQVQMEEARAARDAALTSEQASTSALRAEHQVIVERMEAIDRSRIAAEEQCQGKVQKIEAKSAELAVLSGSLVTSEARILDLTQQLESAATQPLVAQVKELEISVESLAKERHIAVGTESRLNTDIASIQRELADCQDDLKTERAEMSIIQIQLDELSEQNTVLRAEVDDLEDRLELTIHEKQGIEELLSAAQDDQADRSTESEADARNMELVKLKSDLSDASQALEAKEQEMQKELELVSFVKDKIAHEAQERIATLEHEVLAARSAYAEKESALQAMVDKLKSDLEASRIEITDLESSILASKADLTAARTNTAPETGHLGLLYTKISSLRSERDDLRQALSFAQNESRFTIRAAQADRESAIEELEKVKRDLNNQLAVHESLETEVSSVRTQLNEKEAKLEDVKSLYAGAAFEKGDAADQIDQYEREVATAKLERDHLVKELGESHKQIMELNHAMAMMRTGTETDMRHRKISMERKIAIAEMPKITETSTGVAVDRGPLNSSRRPGHSRTKSEIANLVLPDQAHMAFLTAKLAEVEAELKLVSGKLERRNASIAALRRDNEKLKMAEELGKESAEDFEELVVERDSLQTQVEQRDAEVLALRQEVEKATNQIEDQVLRLAGLEATNERSCSEEATSQAEAQKQSERAAELERCVSSAHRDLQDALAGKEASQRMIDSMHTVEAARSEEAAAHLQASIITILGHRQRLSLATGAWRKASRGLRHQTVSLASANQQLKALSGQIDAFEAERDAMSQQLLSHTQRAKALDTANEKIHELESTIETLEAECVAMTEQIDLNVIREQELQAQVEAGSQTQRAMDQSLAQTEQATRALSETQARIAGLEQDVFAARSEILATQTAKEQLEGDLTQQLCLVKEELASAKSKAGEYEARATSDRLAKDTEISSLQVAISGLTQSLEAKTSEAETLAKACESLHTTITDLGARVVESSSSTQEVHALQTEKAELQKQLDSVSVKTNALRIEVSSTMSKNQQLKMELAKLTEESQADRVVLAESQEAVKVLQGQVEQLEESGHKATGLIKYHEAETRSGVNKLAALERELSGLHTELNSSRELCRSQKTEMTRLESESRGLKAELDEARSTPVVREDDELKERIKQLEASLTLKTQEVDEADDKTRDAYKANARLEKKIAKLNRQLGDKELEANTKRNKVIAIPDPTPPPAPVPMAAYKQMASSRTTAPLSDRTPLRPVDNLEPAAVISSTPSLKRVREGDEDQKPLPAEAIMLPPSAPTSATSRTPNRRSFTPKRNMTSGSENADIRAGARNIFGSGVGGARVNVFASRSPEL